MGNRPPILFTCPHCGSSQSRVIDARGSWDADEARRVRECLICHRRFTTTETIDDHPAQQNSRPAY
jgi:transcriptional repressor NrdR